MSGMDKYYEMLEASKIYSDQLKLDVIPISVAKQILDFAINDYSVETFDKIYKEIRDNINTLSKELKEEYLNDSNSP